MNIRCRLGMHDWGRYKQWVNFIGKVIITRRCRRCSKMEKDIQ